MHYLHFYSDHPLNYIYPHRYLFLFGRTGYIIIYCKQFPCISMESYHKILLGLAIALLLLWASSCPTFSVSWLTRGGRRLPEAWKGPSSLAAHFP